jgi:glyoxylase-like metal-dependent hydrolase (beta-lactamase superfamily II)
LETVEEVAEGVFRVVLPLPLRTPRTVNAFVIRRGENWVLIDGGWPDDRSWECLGRGLSKIGVQFADIGSNLLTHGHPDHAGLASRLQAVSGVTIQIHDAELPGRRVDEPRLGLRAWLLRHGVPSDAARGMSAAARGLPARERYLTFKSDSPAEEGATWAGFELIPTSGHSRGSVCLYDPERQLLISGDTVLSDTTAHVGDDERYGGSLIDYVSSLERLLAFSPRLVLPGHGKPFGDLAGRLGELLQHHERRAAQALQKLAVSSTAYQVAAAIHWRGRAESWARLDDHARRLALTETVAHLELLREQGAVRRDWHANGHYVYEATDQ